MQYNIHLCVFLSLAVCTFETSGEKVDYFEEAERMYDKIQRDFMNKYDRRIRPFIGVKPVEVDVFLYVSSLRSISEATMDYKLELYFREYWQDPRMSYDPMAYRNMTRISLHETYADMIWVPDTFLPNAVHSENPNHRSVTHRALLRLEPDGHLLYSRRLSVVAECPMDLSLYPFDQQVCMLSIESYGHGIEDIVYRWVEQNPIVLNQNLQLPDFKIKAVMTKSHNVTLATGTYSRLEACFFFVRSSSFYFVQLFVPATAIVITSWLSLWMEGESTFSDMVEVILAITFLYYSYNTIMPRVSYIKAMDIYLGACFIFVFLSLIKLAILKMMRLHGDIERISPRRRQQRRCMRTIFTSPTFPNRYDRAAYSGRKRSAETENCLEDEDDSFVAANKACQGNPISGLSCPGDNWRKESMTPLSKAPSRRPLLPGLSLDTSEGYPGTGSPKRIFPHQHINGVLMNGRLDRIRGIFATGTTSGRRFVRNESFVTRAIRFRKLYKKVWVILYPLSFFGFCIFYFIAYFLNAEDKSAKKCEF